MRILLVCFLLLAPVWAQRYVNPLPIEGSRSVADPAVLAFKGKYYLFLTGGLLWSSTDLVKWERNPITLPNGRRVSAPHAFEYKGFVYLSGNDAGFFKAKDPLGPWEYAGDITDLDSKKFLWFDITTFADDDGRLYAYYSGRRSDGIYGVELNGADVTKFAGKPVKLWTFDPSHVWERYGDNNEGDQLSWLEAPWMTKHNGTYYLQYSAPGTEWKTYAVGVYTGRKPLGPYKYASRNPILVHKNGLINGVGHHTMFKAPDGNLWAIYTVLYRNWGVFDRRVGMDPVGFDSAGNMFVNGPSETPQWAPGKQAKPWAGNDSGSIAVSTNRYTWSATSAGPGRDPQYAFDNNVRTWWEPAETDKQPSLTLDLGCRNPADANQEFLIDSARLLFDYVPHPGPADLTIDGHGRWFANESVRGRAGAYQYKLESSLDNKTYQTVVDKTANTAANNVEFDDFKPVRARWVRLTVTGAPPNARWGLLEYTVFGKSAGK